MRVQKILSERGVASRRTAEKMMLEGRVTVNGKTAAPGQSADPDTDIIQVDGKKLPPPPKAVYIMLHKPRGVVTTLSDDKGRTTVCQLLEGLSERVVPVGRLDYDSEGLLLLTNDGALVQAITHPSRQIEKRYMVRVRGPFAEGVGRLHKPMTLDGKKLPVPEIRVVEEDGDRGVLEITIHTGLNRQIRRMCELAGLRVTRLKRVAVGPLALGDIKPGAWRPLTSAELAALRALQEM